MAPLDPLVLRVNKVSRVILALKDLKVSKVSRVTLAIKVLKVLKVFRVRLVQWVLKVRLVPLARVSKSSRPMPALLR